MTQIDTLLGQWQVNRGARQYLFIGIGGGSASGKTTIAKQIQERLDPIEVQLIHQDRFFKPASELPTYYSQIHGEPRPNYNRPDSFKVTEMFEYCRNLQGSGVIILEGILALYYPELRELMDIKCYIAADADERIIRRIRRNLPRWSYDDITDYYLESVRHEHARYNAPTERFADIVIPGGMEDEAERGGILDALCAGIRGGLGG